MLAGKKVGRLVEIFGIDLRSLALYRIILATTLLFDLHHRALDLRAHYSDDGVMTRANVLTSFTNPMWVSVHMMNGSVAFTSLVWLAHVLVCCCLLVGYRARTSCILAWFLCNSLQVRNELVLHSGDVYMRLQLFFLMFLPCGEVYSVDAALARARGIASFPNSRHRSPIYNGFVQGTYYICDFTTAMPLIQMVVLYVFSVYHKHGQDWTVTGDATYYALQLDFFRKPFGTLMMSMPRSLLAVMTHCVLQWEMWGSVFFFVPVFTAPLRLFGIVGYCAMHVAFGLCMRLAMFTFITVAGTIVATPGWFWDTLIFPRICTRERMGLKVQYNEFSFKHRFAAHLVATFLLVPETRLEPLEYHDADDFAVITSSERVYSGYDAFLVIIEHSPLTWPFVRVLRWGVFRSLLPRMVALCEAAYHVVLGDRQASANLETNASPRATRSFSSGVNLEARDYSLYVLKNAVIAFFIVYVISWNLGNIGYHKWAPPHNLRWIATITHTGQMWSMFSPNPPHSDFYYSIQATTVGEEKVELFQGEGLFNWRGQPYSDNPPDRNTMYKSFKNHRWYKSYEAFNWGQGYKDISRIRLGVGQYICREWNSRHSGDDRMYTFAWKMTTMLHNINQGDATTARKGATETLWDHQCFDKKPESKQAAAQKKAAPSKKSTTKK